MFRLCPSLVRAMFVNCNVDHGISVNKYKNVLLTKFPPKPVIQTQILLDHYRSFHTTQCHRTPKVILLFIRPIASALSGRLFRRWWQKKDEAERRRYLNFFTRNKLRILTGVGLYFSLLVLYYFFNLEETPITQRRRFMAFTNDQLKDINKAATAAMTEGYQGWNLFSPVVDKVFQFVYLILYSLAMDKSHPYVKRVVDTAQRIVRANSDIKQFQGVEWRVSIFDQPGLTNAMVNADGQIIVFKGKICT